VQQTRVGNYRLMYELDDPNNMVLILGIIDRKDLEEWLLQRY
jgi:mRNA-degrading endonuclease RelE of RelBE toxin-antitoxin system